MSFGGLQWWNFWSRRTGVLYGVRCHHPVTGRVIYGYGGKTFQRPWTKRLKDELWGRYHPGAVQPWADTVLGWRPNGTIKEVIAAGGVFLVRKPRRISPFGLWWREIVFAIWLRRPYYNYQWNLGNRRRIPKPVALAQRAARDAGRPHSGATIGRRVVAHGADAARFPLWFLPLTAATLFTPGLPGAGLAERVWSGARDNAATVGGLLLLCAAGWVVTHSSSGTSKRRPRSGRRKTTRRKR